jgi:hypothetical protein
MEVRICTSTISAGLLLTNITASRSKETQRDRCWMYQHTCAKRLIEGLVFRRYTGSLMYKRERRFFRPTSRCTDIFHEVECANVTCKCDAVGFEVLSIVRATCVLRHNISLYATRPSITSLMPKIMHAITAVPYSLTSIHRSMHDETLFLHQGC